MDARKRFDSIFAREGRGLPVPFLRALALRESGLDPADQEGPAWGLLQVGIDSRAGNVLSEYNRREGTQLSRSDMLDPHKNVRVAATLLRRIVELYREDGIPPDWRNGNYVQLVVAGWNAGYSRRGGVLRVVRWLRERGKPVTPANVYGYAAEAGATRHLGNAKKQRWQRSVVDTYFRQSDAPATVASWVPLLLILFVASA